MSAVGERARRDGRGVEIALERVSFAYGGASSPAPGRAPAGLSELSLVAPAGRVTAVLGPSGAGKSTLLALVAGLLSPDEGDVRFDGRSVVGVPPERRRLGVVFQSYALFAHMTVEDNVAFALRVGRGGPGGLGRLTGGLLGGLSRRAARARVAGLLERFEIAPLARRYPSQLSGGERQRVALARALASEPRALLLDEPLAALDARLRLALRSELALRLAESGVTALYVTHDQEEAMALGDRVALVRAGRLEQAGSPEELYRRPATPFVASFIGEANFLPVTWNRGEGTVSGPLGRWAADGADALGLRTAGNGSAPGQVTARLMVRPEDLAPAAPEAAHLLAEVVSSTFLGGRRRLRVRARGREGQADPKRRNGALQELQVDLPAAHAARPGEILPLAIDFRHAVLLPPEPSPEPAPRNHRSTREETP